MRTRRSIIVLCCVAVLTLGARAYATPYESSLVGYWKFDEQSGSVVSDATANSNDGTAVGGVTMNTSGVYGTAFDFDGVNGYVDCDIPASLQIAGAFTMSVWMYPRSSSYDAGLMGTGIDNYQLTHHLTTDVWGYVDGGANSVHTSLVPLNQWSQITYSWDGTTNENGVKLYLNGVLVAQHTSLNAAISDWYNFTFGTAAEYFDGKMDDAAVWNRALSAAEAETLYSVGVETAEAIWQANEPEGLGLGYTPEQLNQLSKIYANQITTPQLIGDVAWRYLDILPGEAGHSIGDSWINDGKYYMYLGSGLQGDTGGADVPEPSTLLLLLPFIGFGLKKMRAKKV
jgi:hypothetical protein